MKILIKLVALIIVLILILILCGFIYIDHLAKAGIEKGATFALGVETTLDKADVGVFSGEFSMEGLNVANPGGFDTPHFLDLGSGGTAVSLKTLRSDTVELQHITLTKIQMNLEKKEGKSNYKVILDNLKRLESGEKPKDESGEGKSFIVREIVIQGIDVNVDLFGIGGELANIKVPMEDEIKLTDVGAGEGGPVKFSELVNIVLKAVFAIVVTNGADLPGEILGELQNGLAGLQPLSDLGVGLTAEVGGQLQEITGQFGGVIPDAEQLGEGVEQVGEEVEGALKDLENIFGGDKKDKDNE